MAIRVSSGIMLSCDEGRGRGGVDEGDAAGAEAEQLLRSTGASWNTSASVGQRQDGAERR